MANSAETALSSNNSDDNSFIVPKTVEEIVAAEAEFMETTVKNSSNIEGMIDAHISSLSEEQTKKAEAIAKESKEAYDKIDKCNIK